MITEVQEKWLVENSQDLGRMGDLQRLFVCAEDELNQLTNGGKLYLGEALGKHSNVYATLSDKTLTIKSSDQRFIEQLMKVFDSESWISGVDVYKRGVCK